MTHPTPPPVLEADGLIAGYRGSEILHGIALRIEPGEAVGLIGPNGAGKSTMLNTLAGVHPARSGSIRVGGAEVGRWPAAKRIPLGVTLVPEGRQVFAALSVRENLWLGSFSAPRTRSERLETVYDLFPRLKERLRQAAGTLSGGEQQMLAIGRGLMASPTLLMIDEPSLGLAPVLIDTMIEQLARIRAELGITMLIAEQGLNLAAEICDRIYVLASGRIAAEVGPDVSERRLSELYLGASAPSSP